MEIGDRERLPLSVSDVANNIIDGTLLQKHHFNVDTLHSEDGAK